MRLDHVSYATSHENISDVVQRLGSLLAVEFTDGGIHPRFGTRNFTAPLSDAMYIEVVCPLDHPAADATPFGMAVSSKSNLGGGWLAWAFATEKIQMIEEKIGRKSLQGSRKKPDGSILTWKQLGVLEILEAPELPFFVEWEGAVHPSDSSDSKISISEIHFAQKNPLEHSAFGAEIDLSLKNRNIKISVVESEFSDRGIVAVTFSTSSGLIKVD